LNFYGLQPDPAQYSHTQVLDGYAERWLRFDEAWSNPYCSPTRTTMLTGLYGFSTEIGWLIKEDETDLDLTASFFLPKVLDTAGANGTVDYYTGASGKWHLGEADIFGGLFAPRTAGFDYYSGVLDSNNQNTNFDTFYQEHVVTTVYDGLITPTEEQVVITDDKYLTVETVDAIIGPSGFVEEGGTSVEPFFLYVPFNAPHRPISCPPLSAYRTTPGFPGGPFFGCDPDDGNALDDYRAMVQVMDEQTGRLLDYMAFLYPNTVVIFVGDNGSVETINLLPTVDGKVKGEVFEGGVHVPMFIGDLLPAGTADEDRIVQPGVTNGLVNLSDVYETVLELAGVTAEQHSAPHEALHSQSLVPYFTNPNQSIRDCIYTEVFFPNGPPPSVGRSIQKRAVRDTDAMKFVENATFSAALYDLTNDLVDDEWENDNLLADGQSYTEAEAISALRQCRDQFFPACTLSGPGEACTFETDCCEGLVCVGPPSHAQCLAPMT